jgi:hypothetical protein
MSKDKKRVAYPVGLRITEVAWMTKEEMNIEGWDCAYPPVVIHLSDGGKIYASADDEGNGAGVLFGSTEDGSLCHIVPLSSFSQEELDGSK